MSLLSSLKSKIVQKLIYDRFAPADVIDRGGHSYMAYRPDSDYDFSHYPELRNLLSLWVDANNQNNGDLPRLYALILNCRQILCDENILGDVAELGVFRGNSAAILAYYTRKTDRTLYLLDTFSGFSEEDRIKLAPAMGAAFDNTSLDAVQDFVGTEATIYIPGRFPTSVHNLAAINFALVHIDCDVYQTARDGLEFFYPCLSPGGLLILHDYCNPHWPGVKRAADEFCSSIPEKLVVFGDKSGTAMIRKSTNPATKARMSD